IMAIRSARSYRGDRLVRGAPPPPTPAPKAGPPSPRRLQILSPTPPGGPGVDGRCRPAAGTVLPGVFAAGEVAGFGGGGMMGYNALEGTFLGGCLFSGRTAGRSAPAAGRCWAWGGTS